MSLVLAALAFLISNSPVFAFDYTVYVNADSYVKGGQPNKNQGSEAILRIQDSGNNRALIRFDQAAIAAAIGSGQLTRAKLRLNIYSNGNNWGTSGGAVAVHRMLQTWTEFGVTWNCPDDINIANSSPDCTPWVMNDSSLYPFLASPTDVISHTNNQTGPVEWDVTTDVQAFLAGTATNYGWLVKKTDESAAGRVDYSSREGTAVPELVLTVDGSTPPAKPKLLDTFIRQGAPNKSLGSELYLRLKDSGNNRSLIAFDQAKLEQDIGNQTLVSAKLQLTIIFNANNWGSGRDVAVHRMLRSWTELGATWNCADDVNTENSSPDCPTAAWDMTHSANWPFDYNPSATVLHSNGQLGIVEWDVTTDVQAFLAGTAANYGWLVKKLDEGQSGRVEYSSREGTAPPKLVLEFEAPPPPPPPPPPLTISITSPVDGSSTPDASIAVSGSVQGPAGTTVTVNGQAASISGGIFSANVTLAFGANTITATATAPDSRTKSQTITITRTGTPLPPDPAVVAPPLDLSVVTTLSKAAEFLYTGPNPIQTGVSPGTIGATRVAVIRGRILTRDAAPLGGVTISILNHPELGQTLSRADGMFDLVVNGGGVLTVNYTKADYLSVQRQVNTPWQEYVSVEDVVLVPLDRQVTTITTSVSSPQVAHGSNSIDVDGSRRATMIFMPGTSATMVLSDGTTQPLTTLNVRATEYTVGPYGHLAMPAALPPASAYTYAVALTVDEAIAVGATQVRFSQPVISYTDNFLQMPVGTLVPAGYYDPNQSAWVPVPNGLIIKILSITNGLADIDTDGSGTPSSPTARASLGITDTERQTLANLYPAGKSLWRVRISHFSAYDYNFGWGAPQGAIAANGGAPRTGNEQNCDNIERGSIIECTNQVLGESIPIAGTPYQLNYRSNRVTGRRNAYTATIPLSGASVPADLQRIDLIIGIAGQEYTQSFAPGSNLSYTFIWDGRDAYGREVKGRQTATIQVGFVYNGTYLLYPYGSTSDAIFGHFGYFGIPATGDRTRRQITLWRNSTVQLGVGQDARTQGISGWTLDPHHFLDTVLLYRGDGTRLDTQAIGATINTAAGTGAGAYGGDGGPAAAARFFNPEGMAVAPDGTIYISDSWNNRIRRITIDGTVTTFAGNGVGGYAGDGGPATAAQLSNPHGLVFDANGNLYIGDRDNQRVRRVSPNGIITTVAGTGVAGFSGDGGPATAAQLYFPRGVAVGPGGEVYVADDFNHRVRRIMPDGTIHTVAGTGVAGFSGDGGPATAARLSHPHALTVDDQGRLFVSDSINNRVRRIAPDGIISTVAGNGTAGSAGDGGPAVSAELNFPGGLVVDRDGAVLIADRHGHRVRRVDGTGMISTLAGNGVIAFSGDGGMATAAGLNTPAWITQSKDGSYWISDLGNQRLRRVAPPLPGFTDQELFVASDDGAELYRFGATGQHLDTRDALTATITNQFAYDANGVLIRITDGDGNATTIERDGVGHPTAIVSPDGNRTALTVDAGGYLASVTDPNGNRYDMNYTADGLLVGFTDPNRHASAFTYDDLGRLYSNRNAIGGGWNLARTDLVDGHEVSLASAEGRIVRHRVQFLPNGDTLRTSIAADGTETTSLIKTNGSTIATDADGTVTTLITNGDPRFGMQSPITQSHSTRLPSGLTSTFTAIRSVTLTDPNNVLSLVRQTETTTLNGKTTTTVFDAATRQSTVTTPQGRQIRATVDSQKRPVQISVAGLTPIQFTYDARGRLLTQTQGNGAEQRTATLSYNPQGFIERAIDAENRTLSFIYDNAGRLKTQTLPDGRVIQYAYDANGNVTSITPPGRPSHGFSYTAVDLESQYTPPAAGLATPATQYAYNLDQQLTTITRPDGQAVNLGYDVGGRLSAITTPNGTQSYVYHPTTGQLTSLRTSDGQSLSYTHDGPLLKQETLSGTVNGTVARTYNDDFNLTGLSVNGTNIAFAYDADHLLTQAGALNLTRHSQHGLITGTTLGPVTTAQAYNPFGEMSQFTASQGGSPVLDIQYLRDNLGRITQKTETVSGQTDTYVYSYDTAGRLTDVVKNGSNIAHYSYDPNGNRTGKTGTSGTTVASYDDQDRLLGYGNNSYSYTDNGELKTKTNGTQTTAYTYDVLGNLRQVTLPNGTTLEYVIDGRNRRIGKKVNGTLTQGWLYQDQLNPVAELDGSGHVTTRFIYGSTFHVPDYMVKGGTTYRIISDHLGSPRLVINTSDGAIAQRLDYDEFGHILTDTNPGFQPFGFAGGLYDRDTRLVRFGARDYDAETGRWTSKDPIGFVGGDTNLYGYVSGNPLRWVDPEGLTDTGIYSRPLANFPGGPGTPKHWNVCDEDNCTGFFEDSTTKVDTNPNTPGTLLLLLSRKQTDCMKYWMNFCQDSWYDFMAHNCQQCVFYSGILCGVPNLPKPQVGPFPNILPAARRR